MRHLRKVAGGGGDDPAIDNDGIGVIGESLVTTWSAQNVITAITAIPDKFGWDYLLQFAAPHGPHESPERSCKVQVKTTTGDVASAEIKLDNWERMAKERIPWFVLVIQLVNHEPHAVHLVHVGERQVVRVLERLRQLGEGAELHKRYMSIDARPEDALAAPFHVGLRDRLLQHMGPSDKTYLAEKEKWIEESGYPEHRHSGTIVFDGAQADTEFFAKASDWAVGVVDELPFKKSQSQRRASRITRPLKTVDGGTVKLNPPSVTEVITLFESRALRDRQHHLSAVSRECRGDPVVAREVQSDTLGRAVHRTPRADGGQPRSDQLQAQCAAWARAFPVGTRQGLQRPAAGLHLPREGAHHPLRYQ
jgi:hypothetical protein